jgi:hypothetical protein
LAKQVRNRAKMDYKLKRTDFYSTLKILGSEFRDFGACILDIA